MDQDRLSLPSWAAPVIGLLGLGLTAAALALHSASSSTSPLHVELLAPVAWAAVAVAWFGTGLLGRRTPPAAALACLVGVAWLAPSLAGAGALWHRGPLIHLLLAGGSWWPRTRTARVTVVGGYALVALPNAWTRIDVALGVGAVVILAAAAERAATRRTLLRRAPWQSAIVVAVLALTIPPALAAAGAGPEWAVPVLVGYDLSLTLTAVLVVVALRPWTQPWVTDLVVDLGHASSETLELALAEAQGDREALQREVEEAVAAAGRLRARLDERQGELDRTMVETQESLRRLASADEAARLAIHAEIQSLTGDRLRSITDELALVAAGSTDAVSRCAQLARRHLTTAGQELDSLGRGLVPAVLAAGLVPALRRIQSTSLLPLTLTIKDEDACQHLPAPTAATAYFVTAESVTNAVKHSRAQGITVDVRTSPDWLEIAVADDGIGGTVRAGAGLDGVAQRVQESGGTMSLSSPLGHGTTVRVTLPLAPPRAGS